MKKFGTLIFLIFYGVLLFGQTSKIYKEYCELFFDYENITFRVCSSENNTVAVHSVKKNSTLNNDPIVLPSIVLCENVQYSVKYIDYYAFPFTTEIIIPNTIEKIGINSNIKCHRKKLNRLPMGYAKNKVKPWSLIISESVSYINSNSLNKDYIEYVEVDSNNQNYCSIDGVIYNKDTTKLLLYPRCRKKNTFLIPTTVKKIGPYAFTNSQYIKRIKIPNTITVIGSGAFSHCRFLKSIEFSNCLDSINNNAFASCGFKNMQIPNSVIYFGNGVFQNCNSLKYIKLSSSLVSIPALTFINCEKLKSIEIPLRVKVISSSAFNNCSNLKSVILSDSLLFIGRKAFYECEKLTEIILPNSVQFIGESAFLDCKNLKLIKLSDSLGEIKQDWFKYLEMRFPPYLKEDAKAVVFLSKIPPKDMCKMFSIMYSDYIYVPEGSEEIYRKVYDKCRYFDKNINRVKTIGK